MRRVIRTSLALHDAAEIWNYIAAHNEPAADRVLEKIDATLSMLAQNPALGELQEQYATGMRRFVVGNYAIFYLPHEHDITILRILHGARDIDHLM